MSAPVPKRVLVVEDERLVALDLRSALEQCGYSVRTAATSEEALTSASEHHPDIVLMDIHLKGPVDGIETAMMLRSMMPVAIVYLTANTDSITLERALKTSPGGYLAKPYNTRDLRTTIAVALRQHESDVTLRRMHADLALRKAALEQQSRELGVLVDQLRQESIVDPLTSLYNRRHLDIVLRREINLAQREGHAVGVALLDLDHFKAFNDRFGHAAGDIVLREVSSYLRNQLRAHDVAARIGGEELVLVLPGSSRESTVKLADRLRAGVAALELIDGERVLPPITASFGVSAFPQDGNTPEWLLRIADAALYQAKANGRNRVEVSPNEIPLARVTPH